MYADITNADDIMTVEKSFSLLENRASQLIKCLLSKSDIVLERNQLADLNRYLFLMNYRSEFRKNQYMIGELRKHDIETFMRIHNLTKPVQVRLKKFSAMTLTKYAKKKNHSRFNYKGSYFFK